jgi:hypothetical protein
MRQVEVNTSRIVMRRISTRIMMTSQMPTNRSLRFQRYAQNPLMNLSRA